jgi:hypothetical protein
VLSLLSLCSICASRSGFGLLDEKDTRRKTHMMDLGMGVGIVYRHWYHGFTTVCSMNERINRNSTCNQCIVRLRMQQEDIEVIIDARDIASTLCLMVRTIFGAPKRSTRSTSSGASTS